MAEDGEPITIKQRGSLVRWRGQTAAYAYGTLDPDQTAHYCSRIGMYSFNLDSPLDDRRPCFSRTKRYPIDQI
jgi:hypothetical protein